MQTWESSVIMTWKEKDKIFRLTKYQVFSQLKVIPWNIDLSNGW